MTNTFMNKLEEFGNMTTTTNGAAAAKSTGSKVYDMFALGGAYRGRNNLDKILLFKEAYKECPDLALKCLFYLRDIRGGQGERQFFRTCFNWLAKTEPQVVSHVMYSIPEFGRWDDLIYSCFDTDLEKEMLDIIERQFYMDLSSRTPSLLAKWLPSENTSSLATRSAARRIRKYFKMTPKEYRKNLSAIRGRINVLEKLMCSNQWDEIDFSKIPSRAGLIYRNAFANNALTAERYKEFINNKSTKVNADVLYPYEIVKQAREYILNDPERIAINKYWENLPDLFEDNNKAKVLCVCDTSGSMEWGNSTVKPIDVAIGLSMYCAERLTGPFKNHYISFASEPQLIKTNEGIDFVDSVKRIYSTNLCDNTNLEAVFDLLLNIAKNPSTKKEDIPTTIIVISDMQIDVATMHWNTKLTEDTAATEMQIIKAKWTTEGYKCPNIVYWNVNGENNGNIIDKGEGVSFVSGFSPVIMKSILNGKTGYQLMLDTLLSDRYANINYLEA